MVNVLFFFGDNIAHLKWYTYSNVPHTLIFQMPHYIIPAKFFNTTSPKNIMDLTLALWSGQLCYGVDMGGVSVKFIIIC